MASFSFWILLFVRFFFFLLSSGQGTNSKTECHWEEYFVIYKTIWEHHVFILYFEVAHSLVSCISHLIYFIVGGVPSIYLLVLSLFGSGFYEKTIFTWSSFTVCHNHGSIKYLSYITHAWYSHVCIKHWCKMWINIISPA